MRRTVLFYTHAHGGGGAEITFDRLARAFVANGDRVIFAGDRGASTADAPGLRRRVLGRNHALATLRLAGVLRRERPDASFSALGAQNLKHVAAAALAGRLGRCVLGIHGFAEAEPGRLARLFYHLCPLVTRIAARTICVSDVLLADIAGRWSGRRLTRIYNPVPLPAPVPAQVAPAGGRLVLALGRFEPIKRFPDLVAAFARLAEADLRLAILGEGPERAVIEATVARLGLGERVDLPGFVADPSSWYRRAACVAIASRSESFGLTAAEALSHGVAVVTTACGGPPEILGSCGRVVPVGDVEALARALAETLADPGDPAPRRARAATFSPDAARAAYAALIDGLG